MAKQSAMIHLQLTKELGLLTKYYFFRAPAICTIFPVSAGTQLLSSGPNLKQAQKNSVRIFNQMKLILVIDQVRAWKSLLMKKIEFFEVKSVVGFLQREPLKVVRDYFTSYLFLEMRTYRYRYGECVRSINILRKRAQHFISRVLYLRLQQSGKRSIKCHGTTIARSYDR